MMHVEQAISIARPVFKTEQPQFKSQFSNSKCLVTISVGQEVHEGSKFLETINLINKSFKSCILLVDDTVQRHTMALNSGKEAQAFYDVSKIEGDRWLERNKVKYSKLDIPYCILRWDQWLFHENFEKQRALILKEKEVNSRYQLAFTKTIDEFLARYYKRFSSITKEQDAKNRQLCLDYLVEECTALCLWPELKCSFEVYPNKRNLVMSETHSIFVMKKTPELLHPVWVKFKGRKQLKAQTFFTDKHVILVKS